MSDYDTLLEVQARDTAADQLRYRRDHLPERQQLAEVEQRLVELEKEVGQVTAGRDEQARQQRRREDEVAAIESKVSEIDGTMYGGTVTSPKELQTMQEEIAALKRRQSSLEDEVLAFMEAIEPLDARLAVLAAERAELDRRATDLLAAAASEDTRIDGELATAEQERAELAGGLPDDLLAEYERLRVQFRGVAVARLEHGTCGGCHLRLPAMELDRLRHLPPGAVMTCEECGRLLVP